MTIKRVFHNNFRPDKRRKLVGLKKKNPKQIEEQAAYRACTRSSGFVFKFMDVCYSFCFHLRSYCNFGWLLT